MVKKLTANEIRSIQTNGLNSLYDVVKMKLIECEAILKQRNVDRPVYTAISDAKSKMNQINRGNMYGDYGANDKVVGLFNDIAISIGNITGHSDLKIPDDKVNYDINESLKEVEKLIYKTLEAYSDDISIRNKYN